MLLYRYGVNFFQNHAKTDTAYYIFHLFFFFFVSDEIMGLESDNSWLQQWAPFMCVVGSNNSFQCARPPINRNPFNSLRWLPINVTESPEMRQLYYSWLIKTPDNFRTDGL